MAQKRSLPRHLLQFMFVLAGVLIGFALNNWGQAQRERKLEQFYLDELRHDLSLDKVQLERVMKDQRARLQIIDTLMQLMPEAQQADKPMIDSLFQKVIGNDTFFPAVGAYKSMISEGTLHLVRDKAVVTALVELYEHNYTRLIYVGEVLDDQTEIQNWERRKFYSIYQGQFYDLESINSREMYSIQDLRLAYIGLYLSVAQTTYENLLGVQEKLERAHSE